MKKGSIELTFDKCLYWLRWYDKFVEKVYKTRQVVKTREEKIEVFEAFALKIQSQWEVFAQDLLVDCLNRNVSKYSQYACLKLPKHLTRPVCKALVQGLGYFDVKGIDDLKRIAKNILIDSHNPFQHITNNTSKKIDEFYKVRNYIAHYSTSAYRTLRNMYIKQYKMMKFREPGDFLISQDKATGQVRLTIYIASFIDATNEMGTFLKIY